MKFGEFEFRRGDLVVVRGPALSGVTTFLGQIYKFATELSIPVAVLDDFHHAAGGYHIELRRFVDWRIGKLRQIADHGTLVVVAVVGPEETPKKRSLSYNDETYDHADVVVSIKKDTKPLIWRQRRLKGKLS